MINKYFVEFMGVVAIIYAKLLTEADPTIMAIVYFAALTLAKGITTGFFTPIGSLAGYMIGRIEFEDFMKNVIAQVLGTIAVILTFIPSKSYIESM